jgi:hypothetical protein
MHDRAVDKIFRDRERRKRKAANEAARRQRRRRHRAIYSIELGESLVAEITSHMREDGIDHHHLVTRALGPIVETLLRRYLSENATAWKFNPFDRRK